jgi:hypothetical protein
MFVRRAHDEPHWGRFLCRFGLSEQALQELWTAPAFTDVASGLEAKRFTIRAEQITSAVCLITGAVLTNCHLVVEGHRTWRDAGSDAAELVLRALGLPKKEARRLATGELPALAPQPGGQRA